MGKDKGGGEEEKLNSVDQDIIIGTTTNKLSLERYQGMLCKNKSITYSR